MLIQGVVVTEHLGTGAAAWAPAMALLYLVLFERGLVDIALLARAADEGRDAGPVLGSGSVAGFLID